jgi:hypothetical protein
MYTYGGQTTTSVDEIPPIPALIPLISSLTLLLEPFIFQLPATIA